VRAGTYPGLAIVVVDDRSEDDTAALAAAHAAADPRLTLVHGAELPPGWFGKPWACRQGAEAAGGELLLFTDADTRHGPDLHRRAVALLRSRRADLVTVAPHLECGTFWERVVQPHLAALLGAGFAGVLVRGTTDDPRKAIANGQFILVTRAAYEAVGGHAAVRDQVVEDLALAQEFVRAGRRIVLADARDDLTTRMYASLREIVDGWSKNLYAGMRRISSRPWLGPLLVLQALLVPLLFLAPPAALAASVAFGAPRAAGLSAAITALALLGWALFLREFRIPLRYAPLFPLGAAVTGYILLRSLSRGLGRIEWKGRTYDGTHALPLVRDEAPPGDHRHHR